jgi:hypothetical protein
MKQVKNLYNDTSTIHKNQKNYDSFNDFIFSNDRNIFNKLYSRIQFYEMTKHLNGDIVECGVFKGSGLLTWLKILSMNEPNSIKKVLGFDFFDSSFVDDLEKGIDRDTMKQVFTRVQDLNLSDISLPTIFAKIIDAGFDESTFELIRGDVIETTKRYVEESPGFRISVLYLDMDLYKPTYAALKNLWNNVVVGGVIVFDEYAYHSWSESEAADEFIEEYGLKLHRTNIKAPTAYIIKEKR